MKEHRVCENKKIYETKENYQSCVCMCGFIVAVCLGEAWLDLSAGRMGWPSTWRRK